ncbi:diacylglycerol kinase [Rhizobiales bacterium TNE-4]|nr:diacylglycerol kinase [Rhizobiales bacterium TNE-4]MBV1827918.1 diacylglycerol kinase [Rhizobiales bacterium TNE-4]
MGKRAAIVNSLRGLHRALATEKAVRREVLIFVLACPAVVVIGHDIGDRAVLLGAILLVIAMEVINTAIETLCDHLAPDPHERIGYIKDLGSAAVFVSRCAALVLWAAALWQFWQ